jgi:hypothetical protein
LFNTGKSAPFLAKGLIMKTIAGLWIDHRKAIIVTLTDEGEEKTKEIPSNVEKHHGRIGGTRSAGSFESQLVPKDDRQLREFTHHLNDFYQEVLLSIREAEAVLIFGPGEAKGEIKKLLEQSKHRDRVVVMESADKMTDRQITAKVHHYYADRTV